MLTVYDLFVITVYFCHISRTKTNLEILKELLIKSEPCYISFNKCKLKKDEEHFVNAMANSS